MMKVKIIGSPQTQWMIDGHFINGQTIVELTEKQIEEHKDVITEIDGKSVIPEKIKPKKKKVAK